MIFSTHAVVKYLMARMGKGHRTKVLWITSLVLLFTNYLSFMPRLCGIFF